MFESVSASWVGYLPRCLRARRANPKPVVRCPLSKRQQRRRLARIRRLIAELPANEVAVYEDEVDIHLNPRIGLDWMPSGPPTEVVTPGKNQKACAQDFQRPSSCQRTPQSPPKFTVVHPTATRLPNGAALALRISKDRRPANARRNRRLSSPLFTQPQPGCQMGAALALRISKDRRPANARRNRRLSSPLFTQPQPGCQMGAALALRISKDRRPANARRNAGIKRKT